MFLKIIFKPILLEHSLTLYFSQFAFLVANLISVTYIGFKKKKKFIIE